MSLVTKKGALTKGYPYSFFMKNEERYMYPGPIRNQAFDILFLFEATIVAFIQALLPRYLGGKRFLYYPMETKMPFFQNKQKKAVFCQGHFLDVGQRNLRSQQPSHGYRQNSFLRIRSSHCSMDTRAAFGPGFP